MRRYFKIVLINLFVFSGLLTILEMSLRSIYPDYHYYYRTHPAQPDLDIILAKSDTNWLQTDTLLGWICQQKPMLQFPTPPCEGVRYQINQQGFRNAQGFQAADLDRTAANKKRILLLGDSFMFGIYLNESQTIASKLQTEKGEDYAFYNISVPGWGLDQVYLAYQHYVELIDPDQIVLAFVDDDLMRSLEILFHGCGRKPCLKISENQLVKNNDNPQLWEYLCWNNQVGNRMLLHHYQTQAADLAKFMFNDIIQSEKTHGRSPLIFRIPALVDLQNQEARDVFSMKSFMQSHKVNYLELYDTLSQYSKAEYSKLYIPDDGHFTEEGTNFMANQILNLLD